jgi:hypothetical protein
LPPVVVLPPLALVIMTSLSLEQDSPKPSDLIAASFCVCALDRRKNPPNGNKNGSLNGYVARGDFGCACQVVWQENGVEGTVVIFEGQQEEAKRVFHPCSEGS